MFKNPGTKWPVLIAVATVIVIIFGVVTIKKAIDNPVEMSDYGMQNYHEYDRDANEIIEAKIAFDKKYTIVLLTTQVTEKGTVIEYNLTDKAGKAVNDAKFTVILTRPDNNKCDVNLSTPMVAEGKYTFGAVDLPKVGRWDIMAKVSVGNDQRYYNIKADTRKPETSEF
ncbi:MAG: FixH family protein [Sulfuricurvum sp.]|uniref:FixH family protein n=1 Tax=Sulfuricurvum sp. TaxID=2025608 RepID=UPI0025DD3E48|nr:FixH family protein [Sulfuricurvum sp.]MBV5321054.1 FixH family protein [Sulfuricurvum sp.]